MNCVLPIYRQNFAETPFTTKPDCAGLFYDIRLRTSQDLLLCNTSEPSGLDKASCRGRVLASRGFNEQNIKFCCGIVGQYSVRLTEGSVLDRRHSHLFSGCSGFIPRRQSGRGVKLTTYLHLMLRWRTGRATPLLLLFPFMSCTETAFLYLL